MTEEKKGKREEQKLTIDEKLDILCETLLRIEDKVDILGDYVWNNLPEKSKRFQEKRNKQVEAAMKRQKRKEQKLKEKAVLKHDE